MDATDPTAANQSGDAGPTDAAGAEASLPTESAALAGDGLCPFLIGGEGGWRMSIPDRDHRCAAFSPATSLAPSKQARLCLTAAHVGCATYIASTSARQAKVGSGAPADRAGRWGIARTTPVVREIGGLRASVGALLADRRTWPAIPAVLLATLALALGLSGTWGEAPVTAIASPTAKARPTATVRPTVMPSPRPTEPTPTAAPSTTPPQASPSPGPTAAFTTYRVKSGDTLYVIARRFGTTVKAIQKLNGMTSTILHAGQVLKIPA
jgi:LysM repeat protein